MPHHMIDDYLAGVGEPHRTTLQALRQTIRGQPPTGRPTQKGRG